MKSAIIGSAFGGAKFRDSSGLLLGIKTDEEKKL